MMVVCPICRACVSEIYLTGSAMDTYEGPVYEYKICKVCDVLLLNESDSQEAGADVDYSSSGYYSREENRANRIVSALAKMFSMMRCRIVKNHLGVNGFHDLKILDIGCGKGGFLTQAAAEGAFIHGLEPTARSFDVSHARLGDRVCKLMMSKEAFPASSMDVVTMWHVFEHIPDPVHMLESCHHVLEDSGLLIIAVPNYRGWIARLGGGLWFNLDPPRHVIHFSEAALVRLLNSSGFQVLHTSYSYAELTYFSMLQTLLNKIPITNNFMFNFIKNNKSAMPRRGVLYVKDLLLTMVFGALLLPIVVLMTFVLSMFKVSDCITIVAKKQ